MPNDLHFVLKGWREGRVKLSSVIKWAESGPPAASCPSPDLQWAEGGGGGGERSRVRWRRGNRPYLAVQAFFFHQWLREWGESDWHWWEKTWTVWSDAALRPRPLTSLIDRVWWDCHPARGAVCGDRRDGREGKWADQEGGSGVRWDREK